MFKPVPGFPNYEVSKDGQVRNIKRNTFKKPSYTYFGYLYVVLWHKGKQTKKYLHRLIYEAWVGPIPEGMEIHHKDNISDNNHLDNLELVDKLTNLSFMWDKRNGNNDN